MNILKNCIISIFILLNIVIGQKYTVDDTTYLLNFYPKHITEYDSIVNITEEDTFIVYIYDTVSFSIDIITHNDYSIYSLADTGIFISDSHIKDFYLDNEYLIINFYNFVGRPFIGYADIDEEIIYPYISISDSSYYFRNLPHKTNYLLNLYTIQDRFMCIYGLQHICIDFPAKAIKINNIK